MTVSTRSDQNPGLQPGNNDEQQADPVLTSADTERLGTSRIISVEGTITDLTEDEVTVITGPAQYGGSNHGRLKRLRFNVSGRRLILYAAQSGINNYSFTPPRFQLSNYSSIRLAVASEPFAGEHFVYAFLEPSSKRAFVAFAVLALPGQSNKNVPLQAVSDLPRLPRVWRGSRIRESCKVLAVAALAGAIFTYCGLTDPRAGVEMTIQADGLLALGCAIYFTFAAGAAIRWHFGWFTARQRNLIAVYEALGVSARGKDAVETVLI